MPYGYEGKYIVHGPPGTGKTTSIARWVAKIIQLAPREAFDDERSPVIIVSLTRAAAREAAGRDMPIPLSAIGTLHSFGFRSLAPIGTVVQWSHVQDNWNHRHPDLALPESLFSDDLNGDPIYASEEDQPTAIYQEYHRLRHRCDSRAEWSPEVQNFALRWEAWKAEHGLIDFTDMIEFGGPPKEQPGIVLVDEAQDLSKLEWNYVTRICDATQAAMVAVGDAYQALYDWRGADIDGLVRHGLPLERVAVLRQSYRVPAAVHAQAMSWIRRLSYYVSIEYLPRPLHPEIPNSPPAPGKVSHLLSHRDDLEAVLDSVEAALERGESSMLLATWNKAVWSYVYALRERAIPFANPWRMRNGLWNPLAPRRGASKVARLLAFLKPVDHEPNSTYGDRWTIRDVHLFIEHIPQRNNFPRGAKSEIRALADDKTTAQRLVTEEQLVSWFGRTFIDEMTSALLSSPQSAAAWWLSKLSADEQKGASYPVTVYCRRGRKGLLSEPRVFVGTCHSVKGGEADHVYLSPDIPFPAATGNPDSVVRTMYVGMTRARESLSLLSPTPRHQWSVTW
jgi:DNA helicase-2/ATP-dependent DNA helicase PcrA